MNNDFHNLTDIVFLYTFFCGRFSRCWLSFSSSFTAYTHQACYAVYKGA